MVFTYWRDEAHGVEWSFARSNKIPLLIAVLECSYYSNHYHIAILLVT